SKVLSITRVPRVHGLLLTGVVPSRRVSPILLGDLTGPDLPRELRHTEPSTTVLGHTNRRRKATIYDDDDQKGCVALQSASPRGHAILHYASWASRYRRVARLFPAA